MCKKRNKAPFGDVNAWKLACFASWTAPAFFRRPSPRGPGQQGWGRLSPVGEACDPGGNPSWERGLVARPAQKAPFVWLFTQRAAHLLPLRGQRWTVSENSAAVQHLDPKLLGGEASRIKHQVQGSPRGTCALQPSEGQMPRGGGLRTHLRGQGTLGPGSWPCHACASGCL